MDLPKERAVLSSFRSERDAEGAAKKIRALGVKVVAINSFSARPTEVKDRVLNPSTGDFEGLSALISGNLSPASDSGVLQAASPIHNGLTDGADMVTGFNWGLTAVVPEHLVKRVVQIIKDAGGYT